MKIISKLIEVGRWEVLVFETDSKEYPLFRRCVDGYWERFDGESCWEEYEGKEIESIYKKIKENT